MFWLKLYPKRVSTFSGFDFSEAEMQAVLESLRDKRFHT